MSDATALDHVGIVGPDLDALADEFALLGFTLTPRARHAGGRTGNRCIMLRHGYVELLSFVDGGSSATLDRFLARYAGIHILALSIADEAAAQRRLQRAGLADAAVSQTDRSVDDADPQAQRVRFGVVTTPDPLEGRINLVHHYTPEALWQERYLRHANHATALEAVTLVAGGPAVSAARLSKHAGRPAAPDRAGGYRLDLARGTIRIVTPADFAAVLPTIAPPVLPWIAGITLATDDNNVAIAQWLRDSGTPFHSRGDALIAQAGGAVLQFKPA